MTPELGRVPPVVLVGDGPRPSLGHADVAAVHVEDATGDARRLGAPEPHDKRSDVVGVVAVELFGLALRCVLAETEVLVILVSAAGAMALT